MDIAFTEPVANLWNPRMLESGEHFGFAFESLGCALLFFGISNAIDHHRDRTARIVEPQILAQIDLLVRTFAEQLDNSIAIADYFANYRVHYPPIINAFAVIRQISATTYFGTCPLTSPFSTKCSRSMYSF
jgi:hypothetical protein